MTARYAYADPPYLGCGHLYAPHHPDALAWDDIATHEALVARLVDEWPDGWAMSLHAPSLRAILPLCPDDVRVCAWVKPFASFKPGVNPGYAWEPLILRGGRRSRDRSEPTVRDYVAAPITLRRGLAGAKPVQFCTWVLDLLGYVPGDRLDDLFPGTGAMAEAVAQFDGRLEHSAAGWTQPALGEAAAP